MRAGAGAAGGLLHALLRHALLLEYAGAAARWCSAGRAPALAALCATPNWSTWCAGADATTWRMLLEPAKRRPPTGDADDPAVPRSR